MAEIVLCRIDSRLIHGQVMTKWVNQVQANKIIVVSDELAADEFMREIYLLAAPAGVKVECYSQEEAVSHWLADRFGNGRVLLLLPGLMAMKQVYEQGLLVETIQVGGLGGAPNRKVVFQNITLDDVDVQILKGFAEQGIRVIFQTIPEDLPQELEGILKKYHS